MTNTIETNTLRDWLESHQPLTVLDVRSDEDRAQWAIPGSVHVNACEALRAGEPGVLASAVFPYDRRVATVCNALSYPRDVWYVRAGIRLENARRRLSAGPCGKHAASA